MSKSVLYASNTNSQTITAAGTTLNVGTPVRRFGCGIGISGGNLIVSSSGYYCIDANLAFTASGAGTAQIQILKDGAVIAGATSTFTTVEGSTYSVTIPCIIRSICCCESSLAITISGVAGTVTNSSVVVEKL